ncbi:MAG: cyclophilin-like domain-containing protein, partial [Olpidium bornovanus]
KKKKKKKEKEKKKKPEKTTARAAGEPVKKRKRKPLATPREMEGENPIVFFDISIGGQPAGRMKMELGDGTGSMNIYGPEKFPDENFILKHSGPGLLSMCDFLDGKHVVFGKLIDGLLTLRKIENVPIGQENRPKLPVTITECGQY